MVLTTQPGQLHARHTRNHPPQDRLCHQPPDHSPRRCPRRSWHRQSARVPDRGRLGTGRARSRPARPEAATRGEDCVVTLERVRAATGHPHRARAGHGAARHQTDAHALERRMAGHRGAGPAVASADAGDLRAVPTPLRPGRGRHRLQVRGVCQTLLASKSSSFRPWRKSNLSGAIAWCRRAASLQAAQRRCT